ncbi:MAG: hypothetical protein GF372_12430 [Candidatus Marinimicrobia bacterium]|nr:hypothetical protein [Candidatus Neomarinimicrobiota bacterium]
MNAAKNFPPADKIELFDQLIAVHPDIERKGKTMPYTSLNGHMFSFLSKDGHMGLRLPDTEREKFLREYETELMEQYGSIMKEYVKVPDNLLKDTDKLLEYLQMSFDYVSTLKPKPTKK